MRFLALLMFASPASAWAEEDLQRLIEVSLVPEKTQLEKNESLRFELRIRNLTSRSVRLQLQREAFDTHHPVREPYLFQIYRDADRKPCFVEDFVDYQAPLLNVGGNDPVVRARQIEIDGGKTFRQSFEVPSKKFHRGRLWATSNNTPSLPTEGNSYKVDFQIFFSEKYSSASRDELGLRWFRFTKRQ